MLWTNHQTAVRVGEDGNADWTGGREVAPGTGQQAGGNGGFPLVTVEQTYSFCFRQTNGAVTLLM